MTKTINQHKTSTQQIDEVKEREEKRREATRKMWADREKRWNEKYGRPIRRSSC